MTQIKQILAVINCVNQSNLRFLCSMKDRTQMTQVKLIITVVDYFLNILLHIPFEAGLYYEIKQYTLIYPPPLIA